MKCYFLFILITSFISIKADDLNDEDYSENDFDATLSARIIGGNDARQDQFPWMVAFYRLDSYICSGFIISKSAVVSAAHCFLRKGEIEDPSHFHGIVGNVNRTGEGIKIEFKAIHIHPGYHPKDIYLNHDIALLETKDEIPFDHNVSRVCVAKHDSKLALFKKATAMGWGSTEQGGEGGYPDVLQYADLWILSPILCPMIALKDKSKICALKRQTGLCHGDSGGPLVQFIKDEPIAVGIASHIQTMKGCGAYLRLGVYMKISYHIPFLKKYAADICEK